MTGMLQSLPLLQAPLRYLCLQRGHKTPFTGAVTGSEGFALVHALNYPELQQLLLTCSMAGKGSVSPSIAGGAECQADSNACRADGDLECLAVAAHQLQHLERLCLRNVQVGT